MKRKRLIRLIHKKLRGNGGFSLAELLLSTAIMLFATSILTSTITLAMRTYDKSIDANEANALCKTLSLVLRDRLTNIIKYEKDSDDINASKYCSTSAGEAFFPFQILIKKSEGSYVPAKKEVYGEVVLGYFDSDSTKYRLVNDRAFFDSDGKAKFVAECEVTPTFKNVTGKTYTQEIENFKVVIRVYLPDKLDHEMAESNFIVYPINGNIPVN